MVELAIRILLAIGAGALAWSQHLAPQNSVFKLAAIVAAYSVLLLQLERKNLRSEGISTLFACIDAIAIAGCLGLIGRLDTFGFLVLLPIANAASRYGSLPATMAPIAFGSLVGSHMLFSSAANPSPLLLAQAAGVLGLGMMLNDRKVVQTITKPVLPEHTEPTTGDPQETLDLRESFRRLQEMYRDLDTRAKRDRSAVSLAKLESDGSDSYLSELASRLRELSGAGSIAIFIRTEMDDKLSVRAWNGPMNPKLKSASFEFKSGQTLSQTGLEIHAQISSLLTESKMLHLNFPLRQDERMIGAVSIFCRDSEPLEHACDFVKQSTEILAKLIAGHLRCQRQELRMREAEAAYGLAAVLDGAITPISAVSRSLREIFPALGVDHLAAHWIEDGQSRQAVCEGQSADFLRGLSFAKGQGFNGWLELGAPEVVMHDVYEDSRCPSAHATKERISSFGIFPLRLGEVPVGFVTVASQRVGGVDIEVVDSLRRLTGELNVVISRLDAPESESSGICTASELQTAASVCKRGYLIHLEPYRRKHLIDHVGKPNFDAAIQQLTRQIKGRLPAGSLITRRNEGDFVVLLKNVSNDFAVSWANETAAMASFIGVRVPMTESRIPLALRAKVARVGKQKDLVSA
jgi:hypothetical protein